VAPAERRGRHRRLPSRLWSFQSNHNKPQEDSPLRPASEFHTGAGQLDCLRRVWLSHRRRRALSIPLPAQRRRRGPRPAPGARPRQGGLFARGLRAEPVCALARPVPRVPSRLSPRHERPGVRRSRPRSRRPRGRGGWARLRRDAVRSRPGAGRSLDTRSSIWVKDETDNVAGSHKARHMFGLLVHLEVVRRLGMTERPLPPLAIASCGNAALAAAVVAAAGAGDSWSSFRPTPSRR